MKMYIVLLLSLFSVALSSKVMELGDSDFKDTLEDIEIALVKFYAPWCGHCKKMAPEFDTASITLMDNDPPVHLVKVDCTAAGKDTCSKFSVTGYPTVKIFRYGEFAEDYNGGRDAAGIIKYMKTKAGPSSKLLESHEDVEKFTNSRENVIVGFFEKDSDLHKAFGKAADALSEDFNFGYTLDADVAAKFNQQNKVVIYRPSIFHNKFEEPTTVYTGDAKTPQLKKWINEEVHGLAGHRTPANQEQFKKPLVVAYYDVDYIKNVKGTNYWRNRVMKVAKKLRDAGKSLYFAVANRGDFAHELSEYGLAADSEKPVVAVTNAKGEKFPMSGEFGMDELERFLNKFLDGELEAYLKSEPVPDNSDNAVKVVVAKNFDEIVNDNTKDVLVEFYAPWCGHCKSLAPKYEELAEKLSGETDIVIAKMDATANDVPQPYQVQGFPTLYFSPKNSKDSPKKYQGGREVDDFIQYLAKESTDPMKGFDRKGKKQKIEL